MSQTPPQFSGIFISYRRADRPGAAGRLFDNLANQFGPEQIFMDIDNIEPGADFVKVIQKAVASCEIVVAVIGPNWLYSSDGKSRRLDNPDDFVRLEIATALKRDIRLIPVLVEGARMPSPTDLPEDIQPFSRKNAIEISHIHWRTDVARLISFMEKVLAERNEARLAAAALAEAERQRRADAAKRRTEEKRQRQLREEEQAKQRAAEDERRKKEESERKALEEKLRADEIERQRRALEEAERSAEEKRQAEEDERLFEEARKRAARQREAEEARRQKEERQRKAEALRQAEEETRRVREQQRIAEERRLAEENRKKTADEKRRRDEQRHHAAEETQRRLAEAALSAERNRVEAETRAQPTVPDRKAQSEELADATDYQPTPAISIFGVAAAIASTLSRWYSEHQAAFFGTTLGVVITVSVIVFLVWGIRSPGDNGGPAQPPSPPNAMVYVPGGRFLMGGKGSGEFEIQEHEVTVGPFFLDKFEIICAEYKAFLDANPTQPPPSNWAGREIPSGFDNKPVTGVDWDQANAYAAWRGKRLPTEEEWEFAARGPEGLLYPWGNDWEKDRANTGRSPAGSDGLMKAGLFPKGKSVYGAFDMIGNAWEWTASDFKAHPGGTLHSNTGDLKVLRGGSWTTDSRQATSTLRKGYAARSAKQGYRDIGFRLAMSVPVNPSN